MYWNEFNPPPLSGHMTSSMLLVHAGGLDRITETLWKLPEVIVWANCVRPFKKKKKRRKKRKKKTCSTVCKSSATFPLHDQFPPYVMWCHGFWELTLCHRTGCCSVRTGGPEKRFFFTDSIDTTYDTCSYKEKKCANVELKFQNSHQARFHRAHKNLRR